MKYIYIEEGRGTPVLWNGSTFSANVRCHLKADHFAEKIENYLEKFAVRKIFPANFLQLPSTVQFTHKYFITGQKLCAKLQN